MYSVLQVMVRKSEYFNNTERALRTSYQKERASAASHMGTYEKNQGAAWHALDFSKQNGSTTNQDHQGQRTGSRCPHSSRALENLSQLRVKFTGVQGPLLTPAPLHILYSPRPQPEWGSAPGIQPSWFHVPCPYCHSRANHHLWFCKESRHTMECHPALTRKDVLIHTAPWMSPEESRPSELSQSLDHVVWVHQMRFLSKFRDEKWNGNFQVKGHRE